MTDQKHWRHLFNEKFLGSWDLEADGKFNDRVLTIERFGKSELVTEKGKEQKVVIKFKEFPKEMVCNKTNFKRLQEMFGSFDTNAFIGKKITLTTERVKNPKEPGTFVDGLRIKKELPPEKKLPTLTASHERWPAVRTAIASGNFPIAELKQHFQVTPEIEGELTKLIPAK